MTRNTCLHTAIENGKSLEFLEHMIALFPGCVTLPKSSDGSYPLHTALSVAESPDEATDLVSLILRHDPKAAQRRQFNGKVPLHVVAQTNYVDAAHQILASYPEALATEAHGKTSPLEIAIIYERVVMVQYFLAEASDPSSLCSPELLHICLCRHGAEQANLTIVRSLVDASPHLVSTHCPTTGFLPLHVSLTVPYQSAALVRFLLEAFPIATKVATNGPMFPIHLAIESNCCLPVVRTLLEFEPELAKQPLDGHPSSHTALALALNVLDTRFVEYDLDTINYLISKDPDALKRPFADGGLLLHHCFSRQSEARCPSAEVISSILSHYPAAVGCRDHCGRLPLHIAAMHAANPTLLSLLKRAYPDAITTKDGKGRLPIHHYVDRRTARKAVSRRECFPNRAMILLEGHLETLFSPDSDGFLPLHLACMQPAGTLSCVRMFIDLCPLSLLHDSPHGMPFFVAACHGSLDAIYLLAKRSPELFSKTGVQYTSW